MHIWFGNWEFFLSLANGKSEIRKVNQPSAEELTNRSTGGGQHLPLKESGFQSIHSNLFVFLMPPYPLEPG